MGNTNRKKDITTALVVGFALFATFFGAGNLIFPPLLGMGTGPGWWLSFLAFVITDAGLAVLAVLSVLNRAERMEDYLKPLGKWPARIMCLILMVGLCPLVVIPRTCATTYETSVRTLFGDVSPWLFSLLFFALVALFAIRPASVVDNIGKYLTPVLLLTLLVLCAKGVIDPLGPVEPPEESYPAFRLGLLYGYQTMDALMAVPFSVIVFKSLRDKGYTERKDLARMAFLCSLVAFIGLFVIYGGLTYLGATASSLGLEETEGTALLAELTRRLLQEAGIIILAVVVLLACLTTAIGVTSSVADYVAEFSRRKVPYSAVVLLCCLAGFFLSNLGTGKIIELASPVLTLLYPIMLTQVFLSCFRKIDRAWICRGAALGAALFTVLELLNDYEVLPMPWVEKVPLKFLGLGWLLPAVLGGLLGALVSRRAKESA